jgi:hypothetical protein
MYYLVNCFSISFCGTITSSSHSAKISVDVIVSPKVGFYLHGGQV